MSARQSVAYRAMMVEWRGVFWAPGTLGKISAAAEKIKDPEHRADVVDALVEALAGRDVVRIDQIPAKHRKRLGL